VLVPAAVAQEPPPAQVSHSAPATASVVSAAPAKPSNSQPVNTQNTTVSAPASAANASTSNGSDGQLTKAEALDNSPPAYPAMSKRLNEQGQVMVKILIGADGVPQKVELQKSSGFERLDKAALEDALRRRYVPGKRGGVAETMWFFRPYTFNLK